MGKNVMHAVGLLLAGALFSKIIGFAREILFIYKFGVSSISDAYLLTCSIPNIFFTTLSIAIAMNFIPMYMEMKKDNYHNQFTSNLLNICILFSANVCLLINLSPYHVLSLFASSLPAETIKYAIPMLRIVSLSMIPILVERLFQAYSQANENFFSTAILGVITNLVLIATYLVATEETFSLLSIGFVAAQSLPMIVMFYNARRVGFHYSPVLNFKDPSFINMVSLSIPLTIGQIAEEASVLVDRNLAAQIGTGVISAMAYASLLSKFTGSMVINAITTATFPKLSIYVSENNKIEFVSFFWRYFRILNHVLCPLSVYIFLFSDDIVTLLLQHGAIKETDAKMIWECTSCYAAGIIPLGIQNYFIRGFYAYHETKAPTSIVLVSLLMNVILSIYLSVDFEYVGITIATSISYFFSAIGLIYYFIKKYKIDGYSRLFFDFISCFLVSVLIGIGAYFISRFSTLIISQSTRIVIETAFFVFIYACYFVFRHQDSFLKNIVSLWK